MTAAAGVVVDSAVIGVGGEQIMAINDDGLSSGVSDQYIIHPDRNRVTVPVTEHFHLREKSLAFPSGVPQFSDHLRCRQRHGPVVGELIREQMRVPVTLSRIQWCVVKAANSEQQTRDVHPSNNRNSFSFKHVKHAKTPSLKRYILLVHHPVAHVQIR